MNDLRTDSGGGEIYPILGPLQQALSASPRWWSAVFERAGFGMVVVDRNGEILGMTPALSHMLGYSRAEILHLGLPGISHPEDRTRDPESFRQVADGHRETYQDDKRYVRADGSTMWGRLTVMALAAPGNGDTWLLGMLEDITERKDAELRLRRFIAEASHELRTPVALIRGIADLLAESGDEDGQLVPMLQRQSAQLADLLASLLDLARLEEGRRVRSVRVDVEQEIATVVSQLEELNGDLAVEIEPSLVAHADPVALRQVLTNLVNNARAHGQPPVEIRAWPDLHTVVVEVRDHGRGLSSDSLDELFKPFASGATGTGLGLAITRAAVEAMGGMIWYEDGEPGARFRIRLPVVDVDRPSREREHAGGD